jgi:hypothetical protein
MSGNNDNNQYDFDPQDIVETLIRNEVQVRTSKFISVFCVSVMFVMLALMGFGGTLLMMNVANNEPAVIIKQPN